ncbi:hypothetical protein [Paucibacter sp. DJ1R-11]|uniref:hypothetical protein n=1 Tax=Paucibacter sp. DJ1R-11 TaxID=2893556 RepID=UPI0021E35D79|nr:hypothetical protein [Paucibacter sp. DJ1R-11]
MSYLVAFVKFSQQQDEFPAGCYRTDIAPGDSVIVRFPSGRFATAEVASIQYLNWNCGAEILCKLAEAKIIGSQVQLNPGASRTVGLVRIKDLEDALRTRGWLRFFSNVHVYKGVLAFNNASQTARIWIRTNGVDLQVLPHRQPLPRAFSREPNELIKEGRLVRHFLSHTSFNLLEGIVRFAESFESDQGSYDRFFIPQGRRDRRTEDQRSRVKEATARRKLGDVDGGSDDWQSDWCEGMHAWYDEMMDRS